MEIFSQYSDSFLFGLDSWSADSMETSNQNSHSDEEVVMLASSYPKKRAGRTKFKETRHPVFRGVRRRNNNRWVCELREPNKKSRIWLGTYPTAEMAARAHDVAALALKGQMACLNFADSVWRLPRPVSKDAKGIQRAAAAAAEAFRPQESDRASSDGTTQESLITSDADSSDDTRQENLHTSDVNSSSDRTENVKTEPENAFYMDEEAMFDMPGLLVNMAEGLLLSPPPCMGDGYSWDDMESNADVSLWSYSI